MAESSPKGQKTLWEKVKLLVTSNFTFSHSVFKRLVLQTRKNQGLFGKELTLSQTSPGFLRVCSASLLKTLWVKEKLLVMSNFSFSYCVFYPFGELSAIFIKFEIVVCKLFSVWKRLKFVVWERVNHFPYDKF